jgi:transposase-like protein
LDETYVRVVGQWRYVYRAIDQFGQVTDVFISTRRDATAARRFFERAIGTTKVRPAEITTDRAPVYPAVVEELLPFAWHRTDLYATTESRPNVNSWSQDPSPRGAAREVMPTSGIGRAGGGKHAGQAHDWTSGVDKAPD